jgi:5-deoxy-glucuronate isomerase
VPGSLPTSLSAMMWSSASWPATMTRGSPKPASWLGRARQSWSTRWAKGAITFADGEEVRTGIYPCGCAQARRRRRQLYGRFAGLACGWPPLRRDAARLGLRLRHVVPKPGCAPAMPTTADLEAFLTPIPARPKHKTRMAERTTSCIFLPMTTRTSPSSMWKMPVVPLNYFNIVKLKKGESSATQCPAMRPASCPPPARSTCRLRGFEAKSLGGRGVDVWDGEPEGVYVPTAPRRVSPACPMKPRCSSLGPNSTKRWNRSPCAKTNWIWCSTDRTTPRPTARSSTFSARSRRTGLVVCWSASFTPWGRAAGQGSPATSTTPTVCPTKPVTMKPTISASGPNHGSGVQMLQRVDNEPGDAYHIVDGSTICLDKGYHPCAVLPGL